MLAAQLPIAVGFAMGALRDAVDDLVLAYFGDGASNEGDAARGVQLGGDDDGPVVFFCQNNQWAISTPTTAQTARRCTSERQASVSAATWWTATRYLP